MTAVDDEAPVRLVLAVSENGVIGRGNSLPWELPDDLRHFKQTTLGCPIIMGRKTFASVGRPLPGRTNIVMTKQSGWTAPGVEVVHSVADALERAQQQVQIDGADAVCVVGGAEIYRQCLDIADEAVVTLVHGNVEGDAFFSMEPLAHWTEVSRTRHDAGTTNSHDFSILRLVRREDPTVDPQVSPESI